MYRHDAAGRIFDAMAGFGVGPNQLVSLDAIASKLMDEGMELEDIERGLMHAMYQTRIEASEVYISLTHQGYEV